MSQQFGKHCSRETAVDAITIGKMIDALWQQGKSESCQITICRDGGFFSLCNFAEIWKYFFLTYKRSGMLEKSHLRDMAALSDRCGSLPGVPKGENGGTTSTMSPLVIMVIYKDNGFIRRHQTPVFSPAPKMWKSRITNCFIFQCKHCFSNFVGDVSTAFGSHLYGFGI